MKKTIRKAFYNYSTLLIFSYISLSLIMNNLDKDTKPFYLIFIIASSLITVYINSTKLIPYFLLKNKRLLCYIFVLFLEIGIPSLILTTFIVELDIHDDTAFPIIFKDLFTGYTICISIGSTIFYSKNWPAINKRLAEIERQRLSLEMSLLRTQINPHFLLNTLNNIHGLMLQKSDEAPKILIKLSNMLKYILYQANTTYVSLDKEVLFIQNYIEIQRIRTKNIIITQDYEFEKDKYIIVPYLLIIFIENAFKHGAASGVINPYINISLKVEENILTYQIENNYIENKVEENNSDSGFGLKSAKKILDLVYPFKYDFIIKEDRTIYKTKLTMNV